MLVGLFSSWGGGHHADSLRSGGSWNAGSLALSLLFVSTSWCLFVNFWGSLNATSYLVTPFTVFESSGAWIPATPAGAEGRRVLAGRGLAD